MVMPWACYAVASCCNTLLLAGLLERLHIQLNHMVSHTISDRRGRGGWRAIEHRESAIWERSRERREI